MAERQSLAWLRQLLPPQLPRSVLLTVPCSRQPQPQPQPLPQPQHQHQRQLLPLPQPQPQPQHQHSSGAGKAAAPASKLAPEQASGLQPQQVLRFQLSSELVRFNTGLSRAPLCPCHGLPVERLPMAAGSKGTGGPHCWSALDARLGMLHLTSVSCGAARTGTS